MAKKSEGKMSAISTTQCEQVLLSSSDLSKASLATRILIGRLRNEVKGAPDSLGEKAAELAKFASENDYAANDLANL
jgi:hypothetical protein